MKHFGLKKLNFRNLRILFSVINNFCARLLRVPISLQVSDDEFQVIPNRLGLIEVSEGSLVSPNSRLIAKSWKLLNRFNISLQFFHPELRWFRRFGASKIGRNISLGWIADRAGLSTIFSRPKELSADIIGFSEYNQNYFHFLIETIPSCLRAVNYQREHRHCGERSRVSVALEDNLHKNLYEMMDYLISGNLRACDASHKFKTSQKSIMLNGTDEFFTRDISSPKVLEAIRSGEALCRLDTVSLERIRELALTRLFSDEYEAKDPQEKTYIVRGQTLTKKIVNENQVKNALPGFSLIDVNELSFLEQVQMFYNSRIIVGGTGSPFANILFANRKTKILILSSNHPGTIAGLDIWRKLASISGCSIHFLSGELDESHSITFPGKIHGDFHMEIGDLTNKIHEISN